MDGEVDGHRQVETGGKSRTVGDIWVAQMWGDGWVETNGWRWTVGQVDEHRQMDTDGWRSTGREVDRQRQVETDGKGQMVGDVGGHRWVETAGWRQMVGVGHRWLETSGCSWTGVDRWEDTEGPVGLVSSNSCNL